jgi:hypothetical protein
MAAGEVLWLGWAVLTRQWGFVPGSIIWGAVAVRNWSRWLDHRHVVEANGQG